MTIIAIGLWLGFLWLLVKLGILKGWAMWMKLSPVVVWLAVQVALFLPMSWSAPSGPVTVFTLSSQLASNVSGIVTEIKVKSDVPIQKGDPIFRLDPTAFQAQVKQTEAQLQLAELRLGQKAQLFEKGSGRGVDVQRLKTEVVQLTAKLIDARWDLEQTTVRAPSDGFIPQIPLLPGTRINAGQPVLAFLDTSEQVVGVQISQNYLRHVKVGQKAEVIFNLFPGKTFPAKVFALVRAHPSGQVLPSGLVQASTETKPAPFWVELKMDNRIENLPPGSNGTAAIFTEEFPISHVFRQITLRMTTWLNFITG